MLGIAVGGLVVNVVGAWVLHRGQGESLNVSAALRHVAELLGSVGAIAAALVIVRRL